RFEQAKEYARILRRLSDAAPCFATLGNHDGGQWAGENDGYAGIDWIVDLLSESRIRLLHNTATQTRIRDCALQFVGVGDITAANMDAESAFRSVDSTAQTILLAHNPDAKQLVSMRHWHLMLCGHTHGGQLRVPWVGATPFAPVHDRRFVAGLHRWNERWIHVTKGVG